MSKGIEQIVQNILSDPINLPSPFLDYLIQYSAVNPVPSAAVSAPILNSTGLTGATKASRLVGSTTSGSPTSGTFQVGDVVPSQDGHWWICTVAGSPGVWVDAATVSIQAASLLDLVGDLHLHGTGNILEQASVLSLKASVSDPYAAPSISTAGDGSIEGTSTNKYAYACYTWTDGGGHESAPSPVSAGLAIPSSSLHEPVSITLGIPTFPTGVTGFKVYALVQTGHASTPAASTLKRQAATTYISSESVSPVTWTTYNSSGGAPPGSTTFPAGTAALVKDTNGNTMLSGSGTVKGTSVLATSPSGGVGYTTGAGGTGTTSAGAVTVNKVCGQITLETHTVNAGTGYTITVTDSSVAATDTPYIVQATGGSTALILTVTAVAAGSFNITFRNISAATNVALDGMVLNYAVIKAVTS